MVIGGTGFIGRHVISRLVEDGHTIYATHVPSEVPDSKQDVVWLPCDLPAADSMVAWPQACDTIVYLAQSRLWRSFPDGVQDVFEINVAAAIRAAEYGRKVGAQRFIYVSTGSVYTQKTRPAHEEEPVELHTLQNFYFATKLAAEVLLRPYALLFPIVILRLFIPYGSGQHPEMLIPQLVMRVRTGQPIDLHGNDGLFANPVDVNEVAGVLRDCLSLNVACTLNVAGPDVLTLREIGRCIGRVVGLTPRFKMHPHDTPPVIVGETQALRSILGWAPKVGFEAGLEAWLKSEHDASAV